MKALKIKSCSECPKITFRYDNAETRKLIYYCSELKGTGSKIDDDSKIHPDCQLEDYRKI